MTSSALAGSSAWRTEDLGAGDEIYRAAPFLSRPGGSARKKGKDTMNHERH
jgi:hypothetical protein